MPAGGGRPSTGRHKIVPAVVGHIVLPFVLERDPLAGCPPETEGAARRVGV